MSGGVKRERFGAWLGFGAGGHALFAAAGACCGRGADDHALSAGPAADEAAVACAPHMIFSAARDRHGKYIQADAPPDQHSLHAVISLGSAESGVPRAEERAASVMNHGLARLFNSPG